MFPVRSLIMTAEHCTVQSARRARRSGSRLESPNREHLLNQSPRFRGSDRIRALKSRLCLPETPFLTAVVLADGRSYGVHQALLVH